MKWKRDPKLDSEEAEGVRGRYALVRTCFDVSVLWHNGKDIRRCASGSHEENRKFAEQYDVRDVEKET